ncbi:MAG: PilW family protein [Aquincola tertiaricarbonis]
MPAVKHLPTQQRQRGLSLVELMVGITVGLFIVAAAAMMASGQLGDNRRLMLELQVQQELRSAVDLMNRDLRRASGWDQAGLGVWRPNNLNVLPNPTVPVSTSAGNAIQYSYIVAGNATPSGFRLRDSALQMLVGEVWQPITDVQTVVVQDFALDLREQQVSLADYCTNGCSYGSCPELKVRTLDIALVASSPRDATIQRTLRSTLRMPNDRVVGACP